MPKNCASLKYNLDINFLLCNHYFAKTNISVCACCCELFSFSRDSGLICIVTFFNCGLSNAKSSRSVICIAKESYRKGLLRLGRNNMICV